MDGGWDEGIDEDLRARVKARRQVVGMVAVLAMTSITYRLVYLTDLQRTAALFVGVPAALAIGLAMLPRSKSATGAPIP
jgi:hypothetical protein